MDLSILFLFLGIFCWGTVVYLENTYNAVAFNLFPQLAVCFSC